MSNLPVVLFIHGFKGFKDWGHFNHLAHHFASNGFLFVKMNFSHNGTTPDQPTEFVDLDAFGQNNFTIVLSDLDDVITFLNSKKFELSESVNISQIFLMGHSRGGGVGIVKASEDPRIKAIATLAAINNVAIGVNDEILNEWKKEGVRYIHNGRTNQQMPMYYQIVEDTLKNKERLSITNAVKQLKSNFLIIHGTEDETLPVSMAEVMHNWNPAAEKLIIEGANHTFGGSHPYSSNELTLHIKKAADAAIAFFKNKI